MIMRYRKKPVEIDAFEYGFGERPEWFTEAIMNGDVYEQGGEGFYCTIKTLEGEMRGNKGDYIIKGIKGEIYPCKRDIFEASYEQVE